MLRRRIPLACPVCGGENFYSKQRRPQHDDDVLCTECGTATRYGDLQTRAEIRAKEVREVEELKKTFARRPAIEDPFYLPPFARR
jgi:uncharacterized Zn finger protein